MNYERVSIPILTSVSGVSASRKAWFCDVWGVLHDGVTVFQPAVRACLKFRERGGQVILISNSPRPTQGVLGLLDSLGVPRECFDALVTSGDVTRALVAADLDKPMFHLGPERDRSFFDGLAVKFVPVEQAEIVVCTGFFHEERETPEDYDGMLATLAERHATMICANPDLVVERGHQLLPCAGALAARYGALGQTVIQAGKPYRPIYDLAMQKLATPLPRADILAIGDGIDTDIKGASAFGIDAIYIVSRVHIQKDADRLSMETKGLEDVFSERPFRPIGALARLAW